MFAIGFVIMFLGGIVTWALVEEGDTQKFKAEHRRTYFVCGAALLVGILMMLLSIASLLWRWLP